MITLFLMVDNCFEPFTLPLEFLEPLAVSLREKGYETIHTAERTVKVEGMYIPAKNSNTKLLLLDTEE